MDIYQATMIAEGVEESENQEQYIKAWQKLIDTGVCWELQGFFGKTAYNLIKTGWCVDAKECV